MCKKAIHFHAPVTVLSISSGHTLKSKMDLLVPRIHYRTSTFFNFLLTFRLISTLGADQLYTQPVFTTTSPNSTVSLKQITSHQTKISFTFAYAQQESSNMSSILKYST